MQSQLTKISQILKDEDDFLIAAHYNPDGDAMGSSVAMGHILKRLGKKFRIYNQSGLPEVFNWLDVPVPVETEVPTDHTGWTIVLDCGDQARMGDDLPNALDYSKVINIDHHLGNPMFGNVNFVNDKMSSVGAMVALVAEELDIALDKGLGEAVYLALVSDTGFFVYGNTSPETHLLAAKLIGNGLDVAGVNDNIRNQWTINRMRLWTRILNNLELYHDGQVTMVHVTQEDFDLTGTDNQDCEGAVSFIRRIKTAEVSALLREEPGGLVKFSLRSKGTVDVRAIAVGFGGGGHRNASGGGICADVLTARDMLLKAIEAGMN